MESESAAAHIVMVSMAAAQIQCAVVNHGELNYSTLSSQHTLPNGII